MVAPALIAESICIENFYFVEAKLVVLMFKVYTNGSLPLYYGVLSHSGYHIPF